MKIWTIIKKISQLKPGDIVRGNLSAIAFIVTSNDGTRATAVRTVDITNPDEWMVLRRKNEQRRTKIN